MSNIIFVIFFLLKRFIEVLFSNYKILNFFFSKILLAYKLHCSKRVLSLVRNHWNWPQWEPEEHNHWVRLGHPKHESIRTETVAIPLEREGAGTNSIHEFEGGKSHRFALSSQHFEPLQAAEANLFSFFLLRGFYFF